MTIKIPVSAELNTESVRREIEQMRAALNSLGSVAAKAGGAKFQPIDELDIERVRRLKREFESLLRVSPGLRRRVAASGQQGVAFEQLDWERMIPDAGQRTKYARQVVGYMMPGSVAHAPVLPPASQQPRSAGVAATAGSALGQVAQAGLRGVSGATGGVGGVAANAIGGGMSMGFGAGLAGLLGGLGALAVGKLASAAVENLGKAEDNAVALDRLKRTLGDVNVSFGALKAAVDGTAESSRITYAEAGKLGTQYARAGNLSGGELGELAGGVSTGVGLARSFGLDPEQGVGVLGRMRGLGVTGSDQDTRRFAMLIGETIGKAGAFAKADEVMEAIADYATLQTRSGMGAANVQGFAGMFSGLTAAGIPGLDPMGAASLLGRINASLAGGGAKGEASQFFSAQVGSRLGLDPIQLQVMREGGAFATNDEAFGPGSAAARYGLAGPAGDTTFMAGSMEALRAAYGSNKGLLAQATANHFGINMRQAMAVLSVDPQQMGEMGKYADVTKLSDTGIGNLSKTLYGSAEDRRGIADSLLRRTGAGALTADERDRLVEAMKADEATQKQVLAELVASRGQEETQGSIIRDQKALIDNIKTDIASKLIPLTEQMRAGILSLAGVGKGRTTEDVMRSVIEADSAGRVASIHGQYNPQREAIMDRRAALRSKVQAGTATPDELREYAGSEAQIRGVEEEKARALDAEAKRREQEIQAMRDSIAAQRRELPKGVDPVGVPAGERARPGEAPAGAAGASNQYDALFAKYGKQYGVDPRLLKAIAIKESGLNPDAVSPANKNGTRDHGLMQHNSRYLADRGLTEGWANPERSVEEAAKLLRRNIDASGGDVRGGVRRYNGSGPAAERYADDVMRRVGATEVAGGDPVPSRALGTAPVAVAPTPMPEGAASPVVRPAPTPMPEDAARAAQVSRPDPVSVGPLSGEMSLALDLTPEARRLLQGPQVPMSTRFGSSRPFGAVG